MKKKAKAGSSSEGVSKNYGLVFPTGQNLRKVDMGKLLEVCPQVFDKRLSRNQRFESITEKQWQEYLNGLKCVACGAQGGECKCKPEDYFAGGHEMKKGE